MWHLLKWGCHIKINGCNGSRNHKKLEQGIGELSETQVILSISIVSPSDLNIYIYLYLHSNSVQTMSKKRLKIGCAVQYHFCSILNKSLFKVSIYTRKNPEKKLIFGVSDGRAGFRQFLDFSFGFSVFFSFSPVLIFTLFYH